MATVGVELSRGRTNEVSAPETATVSGPFTVELENHGAPAHVHLNLDEDLSRVATLAAGNHYVEGDDAREVFVDVDPAAEPVTGRLKIVTGYGTETAYVTVAVEPGPAEKSPVEVDESLGKPGGSSGPQGRDPVGPDLRERIERVRPRGPQLVLAVVAGVAVLLALAVGIAIESTVVLVGTGVVVGAAIAAFVLSD
ncbi:MAG: hypothetical protein V5A46_10390 [Haloferacaceae archaeon]